MTRDDGPALLLAWLAQTQTTQAALARQIGVSAPTVSRWASGSDRPDVVWREVLAKVADIPAEAWLTREERRTLERVGDQR